LQTIQKKCAFVRRFGAGFGLMLVIAAALAGCKPDSETGTPVVTDEPQATAKCGADGHLRAELYGAISARLDWHSSKLECMGMPRPKGQGARLRFAGNVSEDDRRMAIIIAIPDLQRGAIGDEYASNVTLIEEGSGRFFSTSDLDNCLTDISAFKALSDNGDRFSIAGVLYCVSPLAEVNGRSSVSIRDLQFSGLIDWSAS